MACIMLPISIAFASGKGLFLLISVLDYSSSTSCGFINLGHILEIGLKGNREFYTETRKTANLLACPLSVLAGSD